MVEVEGFDHRDDGVAVATVAEGVESTSIASGVLDVADPGVCSTGAGVGGVTTVKPRLRASRMVSNSSFARLRITGGTDWKVCKRAAISFGGLSAGHTEREE